MSAPSILRVAAARRTLSASTPQIRHISTTPLRSNVANAPSFASSVAHVASRAQQSVVVEANAEGFKAGVLYTLLAGSVATGIIIMGTPNGERDVKAGDLV